MYPLGKWGSAPSARSVKNGMPYAVGTINDTLMSEYQRQIGIEIQARNNVSASN